MGWHFAGQIPIRIFATKAAQSAPQQDCRPQGVLIEAAYAGPAHRAQPSRAAPTPPALPAHARASSPKNPPARGGRGCPRKPFDRSATRLATAHVDGFAPKPKGRFGAAPRLAAAIAIGSQWPVVRWFFARPGRVAKIPNAGSRPRTAQPASPRPSGFAIRVFDG